MATDTHYFKVQSGLQLDSDTLILDGAINPAVVGQVAPLGSLYCQTDGNVWRKYGAADTEWSRIEIIVTGQGDDVDPSSGYTVDTIPVATYTAIKWLVVVRSNATPANRRGYEVYAMHDGSITQDHTVYAVLKTNDKPSGLSIAVDIDSGNLRLRVTGTENVDYSFVRIPVFEVA